MSFSATRFNPNFYCPQQWLWKGNIFTSVCQEICPGGSAPLGYTPWADIPAPWQTPWQTPPTHRRPPWRTVRILLECILVYTLNSSENLAFLSCANKSKSSVTSMSVVTYGNVFTFLLYHSVLKPVSQFFLLIDCALLHIPGTMIQGAQTIIHFLSYPRKKG